MRVGLIATVCFVLIWGCAAEVRLPSDLASKPTPAEWKIPMKALFRVSDSRGMPLGTFTLELTAIPTDTCIAGTWLRAKPIASDLKIVDLSRWWSDESLTPSYQIVGQRLDVQLNGGRICDSYTEVRAELTPEGAKGVLESGGIFRGDRYGDVVVERLQ
jgi:hypothetical protein